MALLKFALIGCGRIGERHAHHINKLGKLAAVCDIDQSKKNAFEKEFSVPSFTDYKEMLEKTDAEVVAVCTPNGMHAQQSIDALNKGFHVLVEKPMAIKSSDCLKMIEAASANNKKIFVVKQNRYNPPVTALKEIVEKNKLGKIFSIHINCFWNRPNEYYHNSWRGSKELDGGTLFTQFSHFIDILYWLFGDIEKVEAFTKNAAHQHSIEFEDCGVVALKMKNKALAHVSYTVNAFSKNMEGSITIFAEKGTIKIGGQYLNTLEYADLKEPLLPEELINKVFTGANDYGFYKGSMSNHDKVYEHVISSLNNSASESTNAYEAYKAVEIIEKIYNKAK